VHFYTRIPLAASRFLARRYGVEEKLLVLLDFDPLKDVLGNKPPTIRVPRKVDSSALDRLEISPLEPEMVTPPKATASVPSHSEYSSKIDSPPSFSLKSSAEALDLDNPIAKRTPARSRVASTVTNLTSPVVQAGLLFKEQEVTPQVNDYMDSLAPDFSSVSKRLFPTEGVLHGFFATVYAKRNGKPNSPVFAANVVSNYDYAPVANLPAFSNSQKIQEILIHVYTKEDNALNNAYLFELLRDSTDPKKFLTDLILDSQGKTLLHYAAANGRLNLIQLLVARGADSTNVSQRGESPLMSAVASSWPFTSRIMPKLLDLLQKCMSVVNEKKQTFIHQIALLSKLRSRRVMASYYMECVAKYFENAKTLEPPPLSPLIDAVDFEGNTALHIACYYRNHRLIHALLSIGASKVIQNLKGESPDSIASFDPRLKKLLVFSLNIYHSTLFPNQALMITLMPLPHQ
jgi:ankyrin repeat protein